MIQADGIMLRNWRLSQTYENNSPIWTPTGFPAINAERAKPIRVHRKECGAFGDGARLAVLHPGTSRRRRHHVLGFRPVRKSRCGRLGAGLESPGSALLLRWERPGIGNVKFRGAPGHSIADVAARHHSHLRV